MTILSVINMAYGRNTAYVMFDKLKKQQPCRDKN